MDFLEFADVYQENRGAMNQGRLKLTNTSIVFKNSKTGKVDQVQNGDIETVHWQRIAGVFGMRVMMKNGQLNRYGGFKDSDHDKLQKFFSHTCNKNMHDKDFSIRGWNWGTAKFNGSVMSLDVGSTTAFEIPLLNVSHCTTAKNEVTLEFHQNDDAAVSLMELRFHIPTDAAEIDSVQAFHDNVMSKASVIQATGDAVATFKEVQCLTPRGRYDIKLFPSFVQLHGKTFDYKIPMTTVLRLFLLPHKDQRQMYFVVSLDPPIKQGQTRYHFLILLFSNEEETLIEMAMSEEDIEEKYAGKLQKQMSGPTFEVISKMMKALVNRKVTVPGNFVGHSSTPAITCSYKAAAGFMYPLERGFIYVHKPPIHIRFEEVASVHFARSGGSTRSFDFEVETKSGVMHTFSSIEKEEYGKLYDFITSKKLRVKNRGQMDQPNYTEEDLVDSDVEGEPDAYLARVKAEAQERQVHDDSGDDDDDESDVSFNPEGSGSEVAEEYDSNVATSSSDEDGSGGSGGDKSSKHEKKSKSKSKSEKKSKTVPEKRKRKKKEKIEGKPKRPQSAYFLWLNENRERIKSENPGITVTNLTKKAAEQWKELKDKTKWDKLSEEAKREYEKAMAEFNKTKGSESSTKSASKKEHSKKATVQKSPSNIKLEYKSKEYISSSEGSSDDAKPEKPLKKKKPAKKEEEDDKAEDDEDEEKEEEEESVAKTEPTSSEAASSDSD